MFSNRVSRKSGAIQRDLKDHRENSGELNVQIKKLCAKRCAVEHVLYTTTMRIAELELKSEQVTCNR